MSHPDWNELEIRGIDSITYHDEHMADLTTDEHGHQVCVCEWCQGTVGPEGACPVLMETFIRGGG